MTINKETGHSYTEISDFTIMNKYKHNPSQDYGEICLARLEYTADHTELNIHFYRTRAIYWLIIQFTTKLGSVSQSSSSAVALGLLAATFLPAPAFHMMLYLQTDR